MLAPFQRRRGPPPPGTGFQWALGIRERGFRAIRRMAARPHDDERDDSWDFDDDRPSFWSALGNFIFQTVLLVPFYVGLFLLAFRLGLGDWPPAANLRDRLHGRIDRMIARSDAPQIESPCLGDRAVQRLPSPTAHVATERVRYRQGPSRDHRELGWLAEGEQVEVIGRSPGGSWSLVERRGELLCFVSSDYLRALNDQEAAAQPSYSPSRPDLPSYSIPGREPTTTSRTPTSVISEARVLRRPDDRLMARYFPRRALSRNQDGQVILDCDVATSGSLFCRVASERPTGWGFGDASLELAQHYEVAPATQDGRAVDGGHLRISVTWQTE